MRKTTITALALCGAIAFATTALASTYVPKPHHACRSGFMLKHETVRKHERKHGRLVWVKVHKTVCVSKPAPKVTVPPPIVPPPVTPPVVVTPTPPPPPPPPPVVYPASYSGSYVGQLNGVITTTSISGKSPYAKVGDTVDINPSIPETAVVTDGYLTGINWTPYLNFNAVLKLTGTPQVPVNGTLTGLVASLDVYDVANSSTWSFAACDPFTLQFTITGATITGATILTLTCSNGTDYYGDTLSFKGSIIFAPPA